MNVVLAADGTFFVGGKLGSPDARGVQLDAGFQYLTSFGTTSEVGTDAGYIAINYPNGVETLYLTARAQKAVVVYERAL